MDHPPTTYGLPKKREEVIEVLKEAYANENLEEQEFEKRLDEAVKAESVEALKLVLFDFPAEIKNKIFVRESNVPTTQTHAQVPVPAAVSPVIKVIMGNDTRTIPEFSNAISKVSAFMSNQKLDFRVSQVPETPVDLYVECFMSNTWLDLRNENLANKQINLHISGALGNIKIMLPRGASIQKNMQLVAGEYKVQDKQTSWIKRLTGKAKREQTPDDNIQLTVNILGSFWFGNVKVIY